MFGDIQHDSSVESEKDVLGGNGVRPTDVYPATIKMAYASASKKGAKAMNYEVELEGAGTFKTTIYITTNQANGLKTYYERDNKRYPLPGFSVANAIALMTVNKEITALNFEEKDIKVYDFQQQKEVVSKQQVAVELIGKKVLLGVQHKQSNRNEANPNGQYVPTGEIRDYNEIAKVFYAGEGAMYGATLEEARDKKPVEFMTKWVEKFKDQTIKDKDLTTERHASLGPAGASPDAVTDTAASMGGGAADSSGGGLFG